MAAMLVLTGTETYEYSVWCETESFGTATQIYFASLCSESWIRTEHWCNGDQHQKSELIELTTAPLPLCPGKESGPPRCQSYE
jgi:hypothetical protein